MFGNGPWASLSSVNEAPQRKPRYTSLTMLRHAAKELKVAFEVLPHYRHLRFEIFDVETLKFLPPNINITKFRLVLGSMKNSHDAMYKPVYAYICRRNHIDRALLLSDSKHLTVKDMDNIDWAVPFNIIYDTYGQTERACAKIGTMAAYYFLAASHVSEIITQNGNFAANLMKLLQRIYEPVTSVEAPSYDISTPNQATCHLGDDNGVVSQVEKERRTPDEAPGLANQTNFGRGQAICAESKLLPKVDIQVVAVNYRIESNGSRDLVLGKNNQPLCVDSTSPWESSASSLNQSSIQNHQPFNSRTHFDQKLGSTLIELEDDAPKTKTEGNLAGTERLLPFSQASKAGEVEISRSQGAKAKSINFQEALGYTHTKPQRVYTELEDLWNEDVGLSSKIKLYSEKLPDSSTDFDPQYGNSEHDFHGKQLDHGLKLHVLESTHLKRMTSENEGQEHKRWLVDFEQKCTLRQKMDILQVDLKIMRTENHRLKDELSTEKAAFQEYKRKIRNLSMIP